MIRALLAAVLLLSPAAPLLAASEKGKGVPEISVSAPVAAPLPSLPAQTLGVPNIPSSPGAAGFRPPAAAAQMDVRAQAAEKVELLGREVAAQAETIAAPAASPAQSAQAGQAVADAITGQASIAASGSAAVPAGPATGSGPAALAAPGSGAVQPPSGPPAPPTAPRPAAKPVRKVEGSYAYSLRRLGLRGIASASGLVFSLPQAGPLLTARLVERAASKTAVLADFDKTLGPWNGKPSAAVAKAMADVKAAGKIMAIFSDRPALMGTEKIKPLTDSLSGLSPEQRAGIYVASRIDGVIYRYDERGEVKVLHSEDPLTAAQREMLRSAAEATIARLSSLGAALHREDAGVQAYSIILKPGISAKTVHAVAAALQAELRSRPGGASFLVDPRIPGGTAEPYINVNKMDKSWGVAWLARELKIKAEDAVILGDSFYVPPIEKPASGFKARLWALGERLSGRAAPAAGSDPDRPMEFPLKGALTLAVGETADPRIGAAYVLDGAGPEASLPVLRAAARGPRAPAEKERDTFEMVFSLLVILAAMAVGWWLFYSIIADIIKMGSEIDFKDPFDGMYP